MRERYPHEGHRSEDSRGSEGQGSKGELSYSPSLHLLIIAQKQQEDRDGGEAIRAASMKTSGGKNSKRRHVTPSTDSSDIENQDPNDIRPTKRIRRGGSFGGLEKRLGSVEELIADSLSSQRKHQKEMAEGFRAANEVHASNARALIELLDRKL
jgi:hypothetical protein